VMPAEPGPHDPAVRRTLAVAPGGRLADALAEAILGMVRSGELAPGRKLPAERDLVSRFGVSRVAVREAIAALAGRGVLQIRRGHRPIVQEPDIGRAIGNLGELVRHLVLEESGAWNLFEARIFVEAALVRHAAQHARPADIAALEAALADNRAAVGDGPRFYATDVAFHAVLYRVPGNPIFPALQQAFVGWLSASWARMPHAVEIDRMNCRAHEAILEAIMRRDADRAERTLRGHLAAAWEFVRAGF